MNLKIEKIEWRKCQPIIESLTANNEYLTPYSEYKFLNRIKRTSNIHRIREARSFRLNCFVVYDNEMPIFVAPLLVNKKEKLIYLLGEFSSVGHLDFIYSSTLNVEQFKEIFKLVFSDYRGYTFYCDRISQFSLTKRVLDANQVLPIRKDICVKIDLTNYDEWYKGLSKSCRQNIRTSYNRINNNNAEMSFYLYVKNTPPKKMWGENIKLFSKRILEHTKLSKRLLSAMIILKKYEALSKALYESSNIIFASVYINQKLAASLNGIIANDGRAIITRLSIETELGKFSPGGLLLNETIKEVCDKHCFIKSIDLSRGNEPYKYTYGGNEHYNHVYKIEV